MVMEHDSPIADFRPVPEEIIPEADPKDSSAPELAEPSVEPDADSENKEPEPQEVPEDFPPPTPAPPAAPVIVEKELPKAPKVAAGK